MNQIPSCRTLVFRWALCIVALLLLPSGSNGEAMLQFFNTSWNAIAQKMPELAEAGYDSLWLPPPTKAGGGLSVGYDEFDAFDLGDNESGYAPSNSTNYGTQADLINLVQVAHRFGIRIYLDNVCNHRGFTIPGYDANTPITYYPGMVPEDFHLLTIPGGFYRNTYNIADWNSAWDVIYESLEGLADIANEPGTTNDNFGAGIGYSFPKISFVRHPNHPEFYCYAPNGTYVGFGPNNGLTAATLAANPSFYSEYVQDFENRAVRWEIDTTKCDGIRLDAVKSVRDDFFGAEYGSDMNQSTYGYCGQIQQQYELTHNVTPPGGNLRASNFNTEIPRANAIIFGEHLGAPPAQDPYIAAGMRLVDNDLSGTLSGDLPYGPLTGLDSPGAGGLPEGYNCTVAYVQSADYGYAAKQKMQYAFILARAGLPVVYTDGFNYAPILGSDGKAFPANSYNDYLGQYSDPTLTSMLYVHNQFARGTQAPEWSDNSVVAFERQDRRDGYGNVNSNMPASDATTMLFIMNGNGAAGQTRNIYTDFAAGSYLWQYAQGTTDAGDAMTGFYYTVPGSQTLGNLIIPKDGYFVLSWRTPEQSNLWKNGGGKQITILQNGQPTPTLTYTRKDGANGDPNFNPYGVSGAAAGSYSYPWTVPCVTSTNVSFITRSDGSTENMLMELDGGVDINSQMGLGPQSGELRDNPPAVVTDVYLGYEQMQFVDRENPELFAAVNTTRCDIGSTGCETYITTVGSEQFTENDGSTNPNAYNTQNGTVASFVYHDPTVGVNASGTSPQQYSDTGGNVVLWAKTNSVGAGFNMWIYYTTDGSYPEGAGGVGIGTTKTVQMHYYGNSTNDNTTNWWDGTIPSVASGTSLIYKIGIYNDAINNLPAASVFPDSAAEVAQKLNMMTTFQITNFNPATALVYPNSDYGVTQTGLSQGFHVARTREFLNRSGRAPIYNTAVQTFYYDTQLPQGQIVFPTNGTTLTQSQYGVVVRTDQSVTSVEYNIQDSNPANDDSATGVANGNNAWVAATEQSANPLVSSTFPNEWRFNYVNIPSSGTATIQVRLKKLTSSSNDTLSDAAGHYTTLTANVNTAAPLENMYVAWPQTDGAVVGPGYVMKVWFTNDLDSSGTANFINNTVISIASSESGSPANAVVQPRSGMSVDQFNVIPGYDELAFTLPNLYNGVPNFEHTITVTSTASGGLVLKATRLVKAYPVTTVVDTILTPPEVDANGDPYKIVLPQVANPTAAQRSTPIVVQTDTNATAVAINFTSGPTVSSTNVVFSGTTSNNGAIDWNFQWNNVQQGTYYFNAVVTDVQSGGVIVTATTNWTATVVYEELVSATTGKLDTDDDGIPDAIETTAVALPSGDPDLWTNDQVHRWAISGKTNALSPDSDNDGLPDGLELGLSAPMALSGTQPADTNTSTSTNGVSPNFQPDLDPPIYNTRDNQNWPAGQNYGYYGTWPFNENNSRTDQIAGTMTNPNVADTDGVGIPDGLVDLCYGIVTGSNGSPILDANGHIKYFPVHKGRVDIIPDVTGTQTAIEHPPTIYNTSTIYRTAVLAISPNAMWLETDPNNSDTTSCGMSDGAKDANHNGIVDLAIIDRNRTDSNGNYVVLATMSNPLTPVTVTGTATITGTTVNGVAATFYYLDFCYPYYEPQSSNSYFVTSMNVSNALAGGGANSANTSLFYSAALDKNRLAAIFRPNGGFRPDGLDVIWLETDPRRFSTSGDGLPDGWKIQYGLNPFDDGVVGDYNLNTGKRINDTSNGPAGIRNSAGITNLQAYVNGDNPNLAGTQVAPAAGQIAIGPVPGNSVTYGAVTNNKAFTCWTGTDQIALDYYDGGGVNYDGEDEYNSGDGYDSSRDMVAFYAHDGGAVSAGGDGNFYFRVDLEDLVAYAEGNGLNIYVAINFGSPGTGEYDLPDNMRTGTKMGWGAVVACYSDNQGTVYLWNPTAPIHTTGIGQLLANGISHYGITARTQASVDSSGKPNGFEQAYFASPMSSCDFSISRQALIDAGWDGLDASKLNYEIFTTKPGTEPGGPGDLVYRSNIHDTFYDDWIASDYYNDQANIDGAKSVLYQWAGKDARNDNGKRVKVISLLHANEAIQPGSYIQNLINTGAGAGLYRPLDVHQAYNVPLTMHITPTLAAAIQWASVSSTSAQQYQDGPALNRRIASMISSGQIDLVSSTFSDHILKYFGSGFNANNVALANKFLQSIYGHAPSPNVFWLPERVANDSVLAQVQALGFGYTFIDQTQHVFDWFGWASSLDNDAYRINTINGMNAFVINDNLGQYLFQTQDGGPSTLVRQLLNQKARDGQQDQVIIFENSWESFATKANADAYDANIAWMASRPWVDIVTPDQIVTGKVDTSVPPNGSGTQWGAVNRGDPSSTGTTTSTLWIDHATNGSYDNWYYGSSLYESLYSKQFNIHAGALVPSAWGINTGTGLSASSWNAVASLSGGNPGLSTLAQATLHASVFETGFHNEDNSNLEQFSTGAFVSPNADYETIATLAGWAQSQTRYASIYSAVDAWANQAATGAYSTQAVAQAVDIDQDGQPEYLLYNDRVFAEFKTIGGRMVNAWVRDVVTGDVFQALGNPVSYAGSGSEEEGQLNLDNASTSGTQAYRTSGFKDLFAAGLGSINHVNNLYTVAPAASGTGWTFTSSDGLITKTVTLGVGSSLVNASYSINSSITDLYVRFGLSPNLNDLLINGQANLVAVTSSTAGEFSVIDQTPARSVRSFVKYGGTSSYNGNLNATAVDQSGTFNTVQMRNQAQTQQVELFGSGTMNIAVGFETNWTDTLSTSGDGVPDWWRLKYFGHTAGMASDLSRAGDDPAGDGLTNTQKYILMLDPTKAEPGGLPEITVTYNAQGLPVVSFPTLRDRLYGIYYTTTLGSGANWVQAGSSIVGTGSTMQWTDNGSQTGGAPGASPHRFYQVQISVQ